MQLSNHQPGSFRQELLTLLLGRRAVNEGLHQAIVEFQFHLFARLATIERG